MKRKRRTEQLLRLDVMLVLLFPGDGHRAVRHHRGDRQALCTGVSHYFIYSAHEYTSWELRILSQDVTLSWSRGLGYKAPRSKAAVDIYRVWRSSSHDS